MNHIDYRDLTISQSNLDSYPEDQQPFIIEYHQSTTNKHPGTISVDDNELEEGTMEGDCPFVVHGLLEEQYPIHDRKEMISKAIAHMEGKGKALGIGHSANPSSIFNNPQLYPQMCPWLFPYGMGGLKNDRGFQSVPEKTRKRQLLLYHDKRFQQDPSFPLIAFNHEQIKGATTGGFLLTEKKNFSEVSTRLMNLDKTVLHNITERMTAGETFLPTTDEEKNCFQIIRDLDHVAGHIEGSGTTPKYM